MWNIALLFTFVVTAASGADERTSHLREVIENHRESKVRSDNGLDDGQSWEVVDRIAEKWDGHIAEFDRIKDEVLSSIKKNLGPSGDTGAVAPPSPPPPPQASAAEAKHMARLAWGAYFPHSLESEDAWKETGIPPCFDRSRGQELEEGSVFVDPGEREKWCGDRVDGWAFQGHIKQEVAELEFLGEVSKAEADIYFKDDECLVAIRGTDGLGDVEAVTKSIGWGKEADCTQVGEGPFEVQLGVKQYYEALQDSIRTACSSKSRVVATGHSLGADAVEVMNAFGDAAETYAFAPKKAFCKLANGQCTKNGETLKNDYSYYAEDKVGLIHLYDPVSGLFSGKGMHCSEYHFALIKEEINLKPGWNVLEWEFVDNYRMQPKDGTQPYSISEVTDFGGLVSDFGVGGLTCKGGDGRTFLEGLTDRLCMHEPWMTYIPYLDQIAVRETETTATLEGCLVRREWRTSAEAATLSSDDRRNTVIVELNNQGKGTINELQGKTDAELVVLCA